VVVTGVSHVDGPRTVVTVVDVHGDGDVMHVGATLHQGARSWVVAGVAVSMRRDRPAGVGFVICGDGDPSEGPAGVTTSRTP
jgi:hypothetical protein